MDGLKRQNRPSDTKQSNAGSHNATLNTQRPTLNKEFCIECWMLGVERWTFKVFRVTV
jgi:hypothetical protein